MPMYNRGDVVRVSNPNDRFYGELGIILSVRECNMGYNVKIEGGIAAIHRDYDLTLVFRSLN